MDKKSIIALVLISVIILTLPYYQELIGGKKPAVKPTENRADSVRIENKKVKKEPEPQVAAKKAVITKEAQAVSGEARAKQKNPAQTNLLETIRGDSTENLITIENDEILVEISNRGGGSLKKYILKKYSKYDTTLVSMIDPQIKNNLHLSFQDTEGDYVNTDRILFHTEASKRHVYLKENESYKIRYYVDINGSRLEKTFIFFGDHYHFDVVVDFKNPTKILLNNKYQFGWKNGLPSTESYVADDYNYNQAYVYMGDELENYSVSKEGNKEPETLSGRADWIAVRTKYFLASISNINADVSDGVFISGRGEKREGYVARMYDLDYNIRFTNPATGDTLRVYLGPLDHKILKAYHNHQDELIMNNGWYERMFRFMSIPIIPILEFLYKIIPNYGIVIILFSILVKIVVFPLTKKSYVSMREMQKINPLMAELKEKYKGDPQRLNKETMKLYKEHGVNPMGGCLPSLIQMPLLIALFIVFRSTIQLRGAVFIPGWITDLSRADTLFTLPFSLPMYGNEFNLLPILMAITMIFQSKMTMQDPKQKAMVYLMPLFMLVLFNRFPSGLNLYYTMFNILTIIQQTFINKNSEPPAKPALAEATVKKQKRKRR